MSLVAFAEDKAEVNLELPAKFFSETCLSPIWNHVTAYWDGVKDLRKDLAVGHQSVKGKEAIAIEPNPSLQKFLDKNVHDLLSQCGIHFVTDKVTPLHLSMEIREFYVNVKKTIFTGKSEAKSNFAFIIKRDVRLDKTVEVGYEMESKRIRQRDIRQVEKALDELLARTLQMIPVTDSLRDLK